MLVHIFITRHQYDLLLEYEEEFMRSDDGGWIDLANRRRWVLGGVHVSGSPRQVADLCSRLANAKECHELATMGS